MTRTAVAIIGAGPYGLSLAAHLGAQNIEHRIFGYPMLFWSQIAKAGNGRYLKSYCFGTNLSAPAPGNSFADYCAPRGLETFEPCSIADFAAYGRWFQKRNVAWIETTNIREVARRGGAFVVTTADGGHFVASHVVIATGLSCFAYIPSVLSALPTELVTHTSRIASFADFRGRDVAVIGAGQSALEAAALLRESGARPQLLVRARSILWHRRISKTRNLWRRLRSPISGLGTGQKAWLLTRFPGALHQMPAAWRTRFVKTHLPAEGAWWLRHRVENQVPIHTETSITGAYEKGGRAVIRLRAATDSCERQVVVDDVVAGTGYDISIEHLNFIEPKLRQAIGRLQRAPKLNSTFESSVPGLRFIGPASAMSFGPLFRFVVGAEYTAQIVSSHLSSRV